MKHCKLQTLQISKSTFSYLVNSTRDNSSIIHIFHNYFITNNLYLFRSNKSNSQKVTLRYVVRYFERLERLDFLSTYELHEQM